MQVKLAGIVPESIVDGPGYRFAIFAQGCPHKCKDCHNPHTHDFDGGKYYDTEKIVMSVNKYPLTDGITFTGGEPFCQPEAFVELAEKLKKYNIYCFTGYDFEDLLNSREPFVKKLLERIDVLVDGKFIGEQASYKLKFKGSENQRVIDCKQSIISGEIVVLAD
ncbi:MAG: anaerobic ribonucleoside-triphosphate reductase activating protein [Oscillospiraceae bacterium]|nr:anaerobic ribonucleoside-triphosphate reductase activating protein [Oscillospiraceae bacterium]